MSTRKVMVLAGVLALLVIGTTGCEECCRDKYDLISADDCPEQPPWQPPGSPIVVRPKPGDGGTLEWTIGTTTIDNSIDNDSDGVPDTIYELDCDLRGDFIGVGLIYFKFYEDEDSSSYTTPYHVRVDDGNDVLEIRRTAFNQIRWEVHSKDGGPNLCDVYPTDDYENDELPIHFLNLSTATLYDVTNEKSGEKLEIQLKMPG